MMLYPIILTAGVSTASAAPEPADQKVVIELLQRKAQEIERYAYEDTLVLLEKRCAPAEMPKCKAVVDYGTEILTSLHSGSLNVPTALRGAAQRVVQACAPAGTPIPPDDVGLLEAAEDAVRTCGLRESAGEKLFDAKLKHRARLPVELAAAASRNVSSSSAAGAAAGPGELDKVGIASHISKSWQRRQGVTLYLSMGAGTTGEKVTTIFSEPSNPLKEDSEPQRGMNITSEKIGVAYRWRPWPDCDLKTVRGFDFHAGGAVSGLLYGTVVDKQQVVSPQAGPFGGVSLAGVLA
jgi:hypothetical protein